MPFELGMAVALARGNNSRRFVLLETKRYRLQRTLSDLNGFDPGIHEGTIDFNLAQLDQHYLSGCLARSIWSISANVGMRITEGIA